MEKTEQKFTELFKKEPLKNIEFYGVDDKYISFDEEHEWAIRGGIEFIFETYTISLGWNNEMHLYEMIEGDLDDLLGELDVYELEIGEHPNIGKMKGKNVNDVYFKWTFYQKMNEDMELSDEKTYIPQEIKLKFDDGTKLQLATVIFQIKDNQIHTPVYDPQSMLLVTIDKEYAIADMED